MNSFQEEALILTILSREFKIFFRYFKQKSPKFEETICYTKTITKLFIYLNPLPSNEIVTKKVECTCAFHFFIL